MGMSLFSEGSTAAPNPDPKKFTILRLTEFPGDNVITIAEVHYPGCTTYGGNKILVLLASEEEVRARAELDPHFFDGNGLLARFPFTRDGRMDAEEYASRKSE